MVPLICFLQNVSFSFSTLLEFGRANLCLPNQYIDLKSGLDQPLLYNVRYFFATL